MAKVATHHRGMRALLPAALAAAACLAACSGDDHRYVANIGNGTTTPTMATTNVETLISDSGYTRYKMVSPLWLMFEDCPDPFWKFPQGIYLEQYDLHLNPESYVECDSAIYFSRQRLWRLDGDVMLINTARDSFLTQQLFWDQTARKMYSDSFIHIVRSDRIIEGYGFESDQNMSAYIVRRPTAILPVQRGSKPDSSASAAPARSAEAQPAAPAEPEPELAATNTEPRDSNRHLPRRLQRQRPAQPAQPALAQ